MMSPGIRPMERGHATSGTPTVFVIFSPFFKNSEINKLGNFLGFLPIRWLPTSGVYFRDSKRQWQHAST